MLPRQLPALRLDRAPAHASTWTTETTHRDGQQCGLPLKAERSLQIYDTARNFAGKSGAIRQVFTPTH